MEAMEPAQATTGTGEPGIRWVAVAWGAGFGLAVLLVVATARAVLDREIDDFDDSGWTIALFVLLLVGYFVAGWVAQRRAAHDGAPDAPFTHGTLAGIGALACWIPLRVLIWVVRDEDRGLFGGTDPALRPGQLFGAVVIAAGIGMLGAFVASRRAARSPVAES